MKTSIATAALFSAAAFLTPAYATTIQFSAPLSSTSPYKITDSDGGATLGTVSATGFGNVFSSSSVPATVAAPTAGKNSITSESLDDTSNGLGLNGTLPGTIGPGEAIVLDFSNVATTATVPGGTASLTGITFSLDVEDAGPSSWTVYTLNGSTYIDPLSGSMGTKSTSPFNETISITQTSGTFNGSYLIGVTNDCGLTITGVTLDYTPNTQTQSTPEPGTFVMAGAALIGLGVTMKRRSRKA